MLLYHSNLSIASRDQYAQAKLPTGIKRILLTISIATKREITTPTDFQKFRGTEVRYRVLKLKIDERNLDIYPAQQKDNRYNTRICNTSQHPVLVKQNGMSAGSILLKIHQKQNNAKTPYFGRDP
eukprot:TRINITY_DN23411_c0_g1_i2.p4 TRINITY_DN23411_c0_g1~~TRINITY_DN23411_c0_g1_i2.p4  ORF type:complete len:125 (-),score=10.03 TRINITY_DN23411_c0_g1_i2:495-869(-)